MARHPTIDDILTKRPRAGDEFLWDRSPPLRPRSTDNQPSEPGVANFGVAQPARGAHDLGFHLRHVALRGNQHMVEYLSDAPAVLSWLPIELLLREVIRQQLNPFD